MCAPYNLDVVLCTLLLPRYSGAQSEGDTPALMAMLKEVSKGPESAWRSWVGVPASSHAHRLRTPPVIRRARYDVHMPCTLYTCAIDRQRSGIGGVNNRPQRVLGLWLPASHVEGLIKA